MTALDHWNLAILISKWLAYWSSAAAIGGAFGQLALFRSTRFHRPLLIYVLSASVLGFLVSLAHFFIQVGAFAEAGWAGMFDPFYLDFLWTTSIRSALLFKVTGFSVLAFAGLTSWWGLRRSSPVPMIAAGGLLLVGTVLLAASFQQTGHTAEAAVLARASVFLHVVAMGLWIGNLYPLRFACAVIAAPELSRIMSAFGILAVGIVGVLLLCGLYLIIALLGDPALLFTSTYGLGLLGKLTLVLVLLCLAAANKFYWVPRLESTRVRRGLARSIELEMLLAALIFGVTAVITTLTGPEIKGM